jgi:hypothetical protein
LRLSRTGALQVSIAEPTYSFDAHRLAGSHARKGRTYRIVDRVAAGDPFPKDVHTTTVTALPERETLAVAADMVRRALDTSTMSARQLLPIMRATANMVSDPRDVTYRAAAMSLGMGSGDADAVTSTFDPWAARQHAVKVTRSRKGRTSFERVKVSMAPVIGGTHAVAPTDPDAASTEDACTARDRAVLSLLGARRLRLGVNALDVQRATDQHYRSLGLPALVGSDSTSWQGTTNGDRTSRTSVASHRAGIDGTVSASTLNDLAAPASEYVSNTSDKLEWTPRLTLRKGRNRANDPTDRRVFVCDARGEIVPTWHLVAPAIDTESRWQGHTLVKRASVKRSARKSTNTRVKSIDIGTVAAPTTVNAWRELLANLNRGERVTARSLDGRVVISRNAQRFIATDTRGEANVRWSFRSLDAMATHLATV